MEKQYVVVVYEPDLRVFGPITEEQTHFVTVIFDAFEIDFDIARLEQDFPEND